jgi:hypothetical protein
MASFFSLVTELETLLEQLSAILSGDENQVVLVNGNNKDSISKAIADRFVSLQSMISGRLTFETISALNSSGEPANGELAEVWNDSNILNNGLYGWKDGAWTSSDYDPVKAVKSFVDALLVHSSSNHSGYQYAVVDNNGKLLLGIDNQGNIINKGLNDVINSLSDQTENHGLRLVSLEDDSLSQELIINALNEFKNDYFDTTNSNHSGFAYAIESSDGKCLFGVRPDGSVYSLELKPLIESLKRERGEHSGYIISFVDGAEKVLGGFDAFGRFVLSKGSKFSDRYSPRSGYIYTLEDSKGHILFGIKNDGTAVLPNVGNLQRSINEIKSQVEKLEKPSVFLDPLTEQSSPMASGPDIICWGDSMTAGAGSTDGNRYPTYLASKSGLTVHNAGVGGESSNTITARTGAIPFPVRIANAEPIKEIPSSGEVQIEFDTFLGNSFAPLRQGSGGAQGFAGELNGVKGTMYFTGTGTTPGDYFFVRETAGEAVPMNRPPYPYRTFFSEEHRGDIAIIWIGQNGNVLEDVLSQVQLIIDHLKASYKKFLVIPKPTSTPEEDAEFERLWGRKVVKIRDYLSKPIYSADGVTVESSYGLSDAGFEPTEQDLIDVEAGKVPTSLRVDSVHFNNAGYEILAEQCYQRLIELKYI